MLETPIWSCSKNDEARGRALRRICLHSQGVKHKRVTKAMEGGDVWEVDLDKVTTNDPHHSASEVLLPTSLDILPISTYWNHNLEKSLCSRSN